MDSQLRVSFRISEMALFFLYLPPSSRGWAQGWFLRNTTVLGPWMLFEVKKKRRVGFQLQAGRQNMHRAGQDRWAGAPWGLWDGLCGSNSAQHKSIQKTRTGLCGNSLVVQWLVLSMLGPWVRELRSHKLCSKEKKKERKKRKEKKELTGCVMAGVTGVGMGRGGQQLQEMREERSPSGWGA